MLEFEKVMTKKKHIMKGWVSETKIFRFMVIEPFGKDFRYKKTHTHTLPYS